MRAATIDIGTNSIRLLIAEVHPSKKYHSLTRSATITRLGEGVNKSQALSSGAMLRSEEVLQEYAKEMARQHVEQTWAVGTSALREAKNSGDFLERVRKRFSWQVEVLSGESEAQLTFLGATEGLTKNKKEILVIDIGGGSTELTLGQRNRIICHCSLNIGCVRLAEMFIKNDPPRVEDLNRMGKYIEEKIEGSPEPLWCRSISTAVGVAGTATTLSAIKQKMRVYDPEKIHGSFLALEEVQEILSRLVSLTLEERKKVVGLESKRADVIVAGTQILFELMKKANLSKIMISEHDILDGLLLSKVC